MGILTAPGGPGDPAFTKEQAAGLIGSFVGEDDNLEPQRREAGGGPGIGIGQWGPARQADFLRLFGHPIQDASAEEQFRFARYELNQGHEQAAGKALRAQTTAAGAADVATRVYERPANPDQSVNKRIANAEDILKRTHRLPPAPTGDDLPTTLAKLRQLKAIPLVPPPDPGLMLGARAAMGGITHITHGPTDNSTEVHVGSVVVNTQATDATGIAKSIVPAIKSQNFLVVPANRGLS